MRRPPWSMAKAGGSVLAGLAALALVTASLQRDSNADDTADARAEVLAYAEGVERVAMELGRAIVEDIKPRLTDLVLGDVNPEQFRLEAERWRTAVEDASDRLAELPVPRRLAAASQLFDRAMREYLVAFEAFAAASRRPAAERQSAVSEAAPLAEKADATYDRADALVQAELRRLGLPTRPTLRDE